MVMAAVLGSANALSAIGSGVGGLIQSGAAQQASQQQVAALQNAENVEGQYFNTGKGELQPFQSAGIAATGQLSALLGLNGGGAAEAQSTLQNLPGYQFALGQGQQAQSASITARGLGLSGAQLRGASDYAQGTASQQYNNYASQLMSLAGLGETAGGGIASLAGQTGQSIAGLATGVGNAQAAGTIGSANALASGLTGIGNAAASGLNSYAGLS